MMSSSWTSFLSTIPSTLQKHTTPPSLHISSSKTRIISMHRNKETATPLTLLLPKLKTPQVVDKLSLLLLHCGAVIATTPAAAFAVTGENNSEEDLVTTLISGGVLAVIYLFVVPPILMNWMRLRWYKRKFLEMYLQFMCVFIFFPGLMLWAPFLNFRKFPRDPTMKYPWSTPKDDVPLYKSR
ncbi:NAD(P)H-quinone oxidoreductase subunit L, chloroplastic [Iris pallida]|uniref:NAD(P)H-quinone oxidoreductase subunit L, chloroplastic n=1 Tax=Iris pallida TaxID=29817 RepID=A0AAX6EIU6_IRIPA|nr:NAD(P)H-quinone oxidoreductase subunit L, chloroplastic [Iris pallida]